MDNVLIFSGHLDTEEPISVKIFDLWLSWSQQGGGSLFDHGQLSMTSIWLNQNMGPPPSWLKLCQISNFLTHVASPVSKWPEKKSKIYTSDFIWLQNTQNRFQKWPFSLKSLIVSDSIWWFWIIVKGCKSNASFFWSFELRKTHSSQEI